MMFPLAVILLTAACKLTMFGTGCCCVCGCLFIALLYRVQFAVGGMGERGRYGKFALQALNFTQEYKAFDCIVC